MIHELVRPKYGNILFYCHILGGFVVVFIIGVLTKYNDNINNKYKSNNLPILRDSKIIILTIKKAGKSLTILDSYCIFTNSLDKLAKDFGV